MLSLALSAYEQNINKGEKENGKFCTVSKKNNEGIWN
jgi:hypothetical protein